MPTDSQGISLCTGSYTQALRDPLSTLNSIAIIHKYLQLYPREKITITIALLFVIM